MVEQFHYWSLPFGEEGPWPNQSSWSIFIFVLIYIIVPFCIFLVDFHFTRWEPKSTVKSNLFSLSHLNTQCTLNQQLRPTPLLKTDMNKFQNYTNWLLIESSYIYDHTFSSLRKIHLKKSTFINQWEDKTSTNIQLEGGFFLMDFF